MNYPSATSGAVGPREEPISLGILATVEKARIRLNEATGKLYEQVARLGGDFPVGASEDAGPREPGALHMILAHANGLHDTARRLEELADRLGRL